MESEPNQTHDKNSYWHPIASSTDLTLRHVYHAQLLGRELAVWRADDGNVNVWENRCLHRGVRLSIGVNDGRELVCQYHGWRYANRTAGCTYIPAHPADSPARTICNNRYPVIEKYGLVWSKEVVLPATGPTNDEHIPDLCIAATTDTNVDQPVNTDNLLVLRPIPVNATVTVISALLQSYSYMHPQDNEQVQCNVQQIDTHQFTTQIAPAPLDDSSERSARLEPSAKLEPSARLEPSASEKPATIQLTLLIQPVDSARSVIRGVMSSTGKIDHTIDWLYTHNNSLSQLRAVAEQQMKSIAPPAPWEVIITPVSESLAKMPAISDSSAHTQRVEVQSISDTATNIKSIGLAPIKGELATYQPGSHIDVVLPNGLTRQYSLTNGPGQTDLYIIGVKREADSTGGSSYIHDSLKTGDVLALSPPRNNFPLRRDAVKTLLIAGGIGITPLLSMAKTLFHSDLPFELHYFVADAQDIAFQDSLNAFGTAARAYIGLNPADTTTRLQELLASYQQAHHVYLCGPPPMLDSAKTIAAQNSWPDDAVHFEYFKNTKSVRQDKAFTVNLARTGITLNVPAGETLLSVLRDNAVALPSSCEQGACGTCIVDVIDGTPLHQDVYLSNAEKERGNCMMTCVSRAQSDSLTLDI